MKTSNHVAEACTAGRPFGPALVHTCCRRITAVITQWLRGNGKSCDDVYFTLTGLSAMDTKLDMEVRAVDLFRGDVHFFEARCDVNRYELSYLATSPLVRGAHHGEIRVHASDTGTDWN